MNERFIAADDLLRDSFQLAANIYEAGFEPDFLVGLWRGGSAVGIAVQEGLDFLVQRPITSRSEPHTRARPATLKWSAKATLSAFTDCSICWKT